MLSTSSTNNPTPAPASAPMALMPMIDSTPPAKTYPITAPIRTSARAITAGERTTRRRGAMIGPRSCEARGPPPGPVAPLGGPGSARRGQVHLDHVAHRGQLGLARDPVLDDQRVNRLRQSDRLVALLQLHLDPVVAAVHPALPCRIVPSPRGPLSSSPSSPTRAARFNGFLGRE